MKFLLITITMLGLSAQSAFADIKEFAKGWTSATHFGYSTEENSSTGFSKVAGSIFFLDVSKNVGHDFNVGLRTIGTGGEGSKSEFYRLGAGPLLSYRLSQKWNLDLGASFFKESALNDKGDKYYTSEGQNIQFGWQRILAVSEQIELSWGGFASRHWGNIDLKDTGKTASNSKSFNQPQKNIGNSRGIEIALRIVL